MKSISLRDYAASNSLEIIPSFVARGTNLSGNSYFDRYFIHDAPVLARVPEVRVLGGSFVTLNSDNVIINDLSLSAFSSAAARDKSLETSLKMRSVRHFGDRTLVLGGQRNYYHWLLNWLSKVYVAEKSGRIEDFDDVLVNDDIAKFQVELIASIPSLADKRVIQLERTALGIVHNSISVPLYSNPIHSLEFIEWLNSTIRATTTTTAKPKIYISRRDAPGSRRQVINEEAVIRMLESQGFTEVRLSELSVSEQIGLFRQAREIVAPHGAGLANCIFLNPGAKICELQSRDYYTAVFWSLGAAAKADRYDCLPCAPSGDFPAYLQNIEVDLTSLASILERWTQT